MFQEEHDGQGVSVEGAEVWRNPFASEE